MRTQTISTTSDETMQSLVLSVDPTGWLAGRPATGAGTAGCPVPAHPAVERIGTDGWSAPGSPAAESAEQPRAAGRRDRRARRVTTRRRRRPTGVRVPSRVIARDTAEHRAAGAIHEATTAEVVEGYRMGRWARLAVTATVLSAVVVIGVSLLGGGAPHRLADVTVGPGDTLWSIATAAAPDRDPRAVIEDIRALNDLSGEVLPVGVVLRVPESAE